MNQNITSLKENLEGRKIAVLIENLYIPEEIEIYQRRFYEMGATVHFVSNLWGSEEVVFVCDIDGIDAHRRPNKPVQMQYVYIDLKDLRLGDYDALLMAANYCSVRLRYFPYSSNPDPRQGARSAPAAKLFADAMGQPTLIKGALCHALWILTPYPELLQSRQVICHEVVAADVLNAGAIIRTTDKVVVDKDLVTGYSYQETGDYVEAVARQILLLNPLEDGPKL